jgi:hypothetical protein
MKQNTRGKIESAARHSPGGEVSLTGLLSEGAVLMI